MASDQYGDVTFNDAISAFDRAASHPNPAFDFLTGFVPRKLKDLFKWCEYLVYNSAHIYATLRKFGELVITELEYGTSNDALRRNYKRLYEKSLKVKNSLLMASFDLDVYGNHFTSMYQPFVRYLKCNKCDTLVNINVLDYKFTLRKMQFRYHCRKCNTEVEGKIVDQSILAANRLHVIRWDPKAMDINYNPMTGQSVYYYTIPGEIRDKVTKGDKHLINTMPKEFLEAIKDNNVFEFEKDSIFHLKVPGPSGIDQQWGFPPLTATIKLFLYTMVLRKANEAIALEHIVPMRIMHPDSGRGVGQDPTQYLSMQRWQQEMKHNIRRWRRDPLHIMFAPVPVGVTHVGGEAKAMLTLGEVQEAEKNILAAMGLPPEFLYGGLTKAGMDGNIRMIENATQYRADALNDLLQWYTDNVAKFLGWERIDISMARIKMVDDTEVKQLMIGLATGQFNGQQVVSWTTLGDRLGFDLQDERDKRKQEALDESRFQMDMQREMQKQQSTLSQQAHQSAAGGLGYDPQAVLGQAEQIVQELGMMDPGSKRSRLHDLQVTDYVMYSVVIQRLEAADNEMTNQAKASIREGGVQ